MKLIQEECTVRHFFFLNRLLTMCSGPDNDRIGIGNWISLIDAHWKILSFEFGPEFDRCPHISLAPSYVAIAGERLDRKLDQEAREVLAREILKDIVLEDWAIHSINTYYSHSTGKRIPCYGGIERFNDNISIDDETVFDVNRSASYYDCSLAHGRYLDGTQEGTLYKLWNSLRLKHTPLGLRLFRIFLRMLRGYAPLDSYYREEKFYLQISEAILGEDSNLRDGAILASICSTNSNPTNKTQKKGWFRRLKRKVKNFKKNLAGEKPRNR